jgi:hypothetical protein
MQEHTWKEFQATGMLWWINMILHTFGWAIVVQTDEQGDLVKAYPARVSWRGFSSMANGEGYLKVAAYLAEHAETLHAETLDE